MGGNSKRKAYLKRQARNARWDLLATKALLTTSDPSSLYDINRADAVLGLLGVHQTAGNRTRLYEALDRAGITLSTTHYVW